MTTGARKSTGLRCVRRVRGRGDPGDPARPVRQRPLRLPAAVQPGPRRHGVPGQDVVEVVPAAGEAEVRVAAQRRPLDVHPVLPGHPAHPARTRPARCGDVDAHPDELVHRPRGETVAADLLPGKRAFSSRITSTPARARWYAAEEPAGPAPTTITWASVSVRDASRASVSVVAGSVGCSRMTTLSSHGCCSAPGRRPRPTSSIRTGRGDTRRPDNRGRRSEPAVYAPSVTTPPDDPISDALDRADAGLLARRLDARTCPPELLGRLVRHPAPASGTWA